MKLIILVFLIFLQIAGKIVVRFPEYDHVAEGNDDKEASDADVTSTEPPNPETTTDPPIMDCECAVFSSAFPAKSDSPILVQIPNYVDCKFDGEEDCIALCSILAKAAKKHGPIIICTILGDCKDLNASIHSRVLCTASNKWIYTGLTSSDKICCKNGTVIHCSEDN